MAQLDDIPTTHRRVSPNDAALGFAKPLKMKWIGTELDKHSAIPGPRIHLQVDEYSNVKTVG